ncbi:MAG: VWA domain-containing protein [Phycisphaerae bacterium]|nr:VWA domain-containing protein [Phycisphaerae bacterium]
MRIRILAALAVACVTFGALVHAQVASAPDDGRTIVPWRSVRPDRVRAEAVRVRSVGVAVTIEDQACTTALDFELFNPSPLPQETELLIPVPEGVVVRSFQYDGTGPEPTTAVLPRDEARRAYDSIVRRSRDPGLLEFAGSGAIRTSVFPVPAGAAQHVRITYEQVLQADGARVDYVLPRSDSSSPERGVELVRWSMSAEIRSSRPITTVYSPSHELALDRRAPGHVAARVAESASRLPGSWRLSYLIARPDASSPLPATVMAYPDPSLPGGRGGYFMLLMGMPAAAPTEAARVKREVTLVIDRSGSMRGGKIEQARQAALDVLEGLEPGEFFNIIDYSDSVASYAPAPVEKTGASLAGARAYVSGLRAEGGTFLHGALMESLRPAPTPGALPLVLFLTDGLPTIGERSEVAIREGAKNGNVHRRRIFTFGVGLDVNTPLLSGLAASSRGAPTFILPDESVEVKVSQVFRRLRGPVLAAPRLSAVGEGAGAGGASAVREAQPGVIPDQFDSDQLIVLGQYTSAAPMKLKLEGEYLGEPRTFEVAFDPASASVRNGFVPRLWAMRKIGSLIDAVRQAGADGRNSSSDTATKELVDEIVRLSMRFGIMTEYTSFLATEPVIGRATIGGETGRPAAPVSQAPAAAKKAFDDRNATRSGLGAVNQEQNGAALRDAAQAGAGGGGYLDSDMKHVEVRSVRNVADQSFFFRGERWVDARLMRDENEKPDRTVEFGTPEYDAVVEALVKANLQAVLAYPGEVLVLLDGARTLIRQP